MFDIFLGLGDPSAAKAGSWQTGDKRIQGFKVCQTYSLVVRFIKTTYSWNGSEIKFMFCEADDISAALIRYSHPGVADNWDWSNFCGHPSQTSGRECLIAWTALVDQCGCEEGKGQTNSIEMSLFLSPKIPPDHPPFLWITEYFFQAAQRFLGI